MTLKFKVIYEQKSNSSWSIYRTNENTPKYELNQSLNYNVKANYSKIR